MQTPHKFVDLVEKELGIKMINEEKVTRVIYGIATSKGLIDGLGEDATPEDILAKYDSYHGYMTKDRYKVKHGTFYDEKTKRFAKKQIVLLIKMNGEYVEQEEDAPESLEIKVAKRAYKKSKKLETE